MKLISGTKFNRSTLQMDGFVDMDEISTGKAGKEDDLGDHVLVVGYQTFRGKTVQALAAFLSKGNVKAKELTNIILESTMKLESSGWAVDGVTMDGAPWNRKVWDALGITEEKPSTAHPYDDQRRLWMFSDYPHLLKCMRNCLAENKIIQVIFRFHSILNQIH